MVSRQPELSVLLASPDLRRSSENTFVVATTYGTPARRSSTDWRTLAHCSDDRACNLRHGRGSTRAAGRQGCRACAVDDQPRLRRSRAQRSGARLQIGGSLAQETRSIRPMVLPSLRRRSSGTARPCRRVALGSRSRCRQGVGRDSWRPQGSGREPRRARTPQRGSSHRREL